MLRVEEKALPEPPFRIREQAETRGWIYSKTINDFTRRPALGQRPEQILHTAVSTTEDYHFRIRNRASATLFL
jgi:hypothetical protein